MTAQTYSREDLEALVLEAITNIGIDNISIADIYEYLVIDNKHPLYKHEISRTVWSLCDQGKAIVRSGYIYEC